MHTNVISFHIHRHLTKYKVSLKMQQLQHFNNPNNSQKSSNLISLLRIKTTQALKSSNIHNHSLPIPFKPSDFPNLEKGPSNIRATFRCIIPKGSHSTGPVFYNHSPKGIKRCVVVLKHSYHFWDITENARSVNHGTLRRAFEVLVGLTFCWCRFRKEMSRNGLKFSGNYVV